jgi:DNA-binding MarR family transcriptional regulator
MSTVRDEHELFAAWMNLLQAQSVVSEALEDRLQADSGLSLAEHEALSRMAGSPEGDLRMAELADLMLVSKSGVTRLIDRLEARGLVARRACETDRRATYAAITEKGRITAERAWPVLAEGLTESFSRHLGDADVKALRKAMRKILAGNGKWEDTRCSVGFQEHVAPRAAQTGERSAG